MSRAALAGVILVAATSFAGAQPAARPAGRAQAVIIGIIHPRRELPRPRPV
jgi:hypothetical protein